MEQAICKHCAESFSYERKGKHKQFCTEKCGNQFHNKSYELRRPPRLKKRVLNAKAIERKKRTNRVGRHTVTIEQIEWLLVEQAFACAICESLITWNTMHLDHDHKCCHNKHGESCGRCFRGLLCMDCNLALGRFKDDTVILQNAIYYLSIRG